MKYEILFRMSVLIVIYLFVLGLILGSFINAWVWRLRQQLDDDGEPKKLSKKQRKELSILHGRSMCPHCKHELSAKDLVPLFSWLLLKGRCRYCKQPINKQYPLVELLTATLFAGSFVFWPTTITGYEWILFIGWLAALVPLIAMAVYDFWWYILPSKLIYIATGTYGFSLATYSGLSGNWSTLYAALAAAVTYFVLFFSIFILSSLAKSQKWSNKDWLGFGDVRLAFLLGLIAGSVINVFIALFLASITGLLATLPIMARKNLTLSSQIPFGPFLIIGAILAIFFGENLMQWYTGAILGI